MDFLINLLKSAAAYLGAFFSGRMSQKYDDVKSNYKREKKRDKIDAERTHSPDDVLKRMRDKGF